MSTPPSTSPESESSRAPLSGTLSRADSTRLVLVVSLVVFQGLLRLAERTLPAVVLEWGFGPFVVGLLGSLTLAAAVVVRFVDVRPQSTEIVALVSTVLASTGLLVWTGAPSLDALLGTSLSTIGWLILGATFLGPWHARGPGRELALGDGGMAVVPPLARRYSKSEWAEDDDSRTDRSRTGNGRTRLAAGALGLVGGAILATAAFVGSDTVRAGFTLVASTGAAVGLVAAVSLVVLTLESESTPESESESDVDSDSSHESASDSTSESGAPVTVVGSATDPESGSGHEPERTPETDFDLETVREAIESLPRAARRTIVGDVLVRLAVVSTSLYVVLLVVDYHGVVGTTVGSVSIPPIAVFTLFVLAEAIGALGGALAAPLVADTVAASVDRRWLLVGGLALVSLVPVTLVASANPAVLALAFVLLGGRTAIRPLRPTVHVSESTRTEGETELPDPIGVGIHAALVPAPLLGGVLYTISPVAAFAIATTVGLLGVRELLEPLESGGD